MRISDEGLELIKKFEGLRLVAYQDSIGMWTCGYGHTRDVQKELHCTEAIADAWLKEDVHHAETCINNSVSVPLTQGEFDALVSFVFNLGCAKFRGSTLLRKLNDGDYDGASAEFSRWDKAGGKVLAGLTARREAEAKRFEA